MPACSSRSHDLDTRPVASWSSATADTGCQPEVAPAHERQPIEPQAVAPKSGKKSAYLAARGITQVGMLAMAALAVSPSWQRLSVRAWPGAEATPNGLPVVLVLGSLVVGAYLLTCALRPQCHAVDGQSQQSS